LEKGHDKQAKNRWQILAGDEAGLGEIRQATVGAMGGEVPDMLDNV
jgi:hypothetical protein